MKKLCILFTLVALVFTSCQKEPTACFSASSLTADVGETVTFTNCSVDADHYKWTFSDGQVSDNKSVTYTTNKPGSYTVTLEAFSKNGKKVDEEIEVIQVIKPWRNDFLGTYTISDDCDINNYNSTISESSSDPQKVRISNFANVFINKVTADITSEDDIDIPNQEPDNDNWWVTGNGTLSGSTITLSYTVTDPNYTQTTCSTTWTK